jgi:uncharacterized protein with PIN domain
MRDGEDEELVRCETESQALLQKTSSSEIPERVKELDRRVAEIRTLLYQCPSCERLFWYRGRGGEPEVFTREQKPI